LRLLAPMEEESDGMAVVLVCNKCRPRKMLAGL
jgi:hypothetical protein